MDITANNLSAGIGEQRFCTRCGTCSGACPTGAIKRDLQLYPCLTEAKCTNCGLCAKICPGKDLSFQALYQDVFSRDSYPEDYCGSFVQAYAAYSTNKTVREKGASGGVVTELLLYLLEKGKIAGTFVTSIDPENPLRAKTFLARTPEEILSAQQSKYIICPVNDALKVIRKEKGPFAYVGLPCQVQGLRKWMMANKFVKERIPYVIGLFCATSFELPIIEELTEIKGRGRKTLRDFRFRDGVWPGNICAIYGEQETAKLHYGDFKDGAINYLTQLYSPYRCRLCTDGMAEFADISVADAWMRRADKSYLYPAMSTVVVRTETGKSLVNSAITDGRIKTYPVTKQSLYVTYLTLEKNKKRYARIRAARWAKKGLPVPGYDELMPKTDWRDLFAERRMSFYQSLGHFPTVRKLLLKLLLSKYLIPLITLRRKIKERNLPDCDSD